MPDPSILGALRDAQFWKDMAGGVGDVAGTLGSSIALEPIAGLAGLARTPQGSEKAAETVEALRGYGYQPDQGSVGARALESIGQLMAPVEEGLQGVSDYAYEKTGSPLVGALTRAGSEGLLELVGGGGAGQGAMGIVRRVPGYDPRKAEAEWEMAQAPAEASQNTQIAQVSKKEPGVATGTGLTYQKAAGLMGEEGRALDFGAGRGEGTQFLGGEVDTFEPFPREGFEPTYRDPSEVPSGEFDRLLSSATINVTPPLTSEHQMMTIARALREGGEGVVSARTPSAVNTAKTAQEIDGLPGVRIGEQYQQGYTPQELIDMAGRSGLEAEKQGGFSGATVKVRAPEADDLTRQAVEAEAPGRKVYDVGRETPDGGKEVHRDYKQILPQQPLARAMDAADAEGRVWNVAKLEPDGSVTLSKRDIESEPDAWKLVSTDHPLFSEKLMRRYRPLRPETVKEIETQKRARQTIDDLAAQIVARREGTDLPAPSPRTLTEDLTAAVDAAEPVKGKRAIVAALIERGVPEADALDIQKSMGAGGADKPLTMANIERAAAKRKELLAETADRKPVGEMTPDEFTEFGSQYGVNTARTPLETVVDPATGREWQLPGGLDRDKPLTIADAGYIKSQAIDPNEMSAEFQARLQEKLLDSTTPDADDPLEMFNRMMLAQQSSNTPLLGNEFLTMRMRVRTPEDLAKLGDMIDWEPGTKVPKAKRAAAEKKIADAYGIGAAETGGMGLRSSPDLSALAEMAKLYRKHPDWFKRKADEPWQEYAERMIATQNGLSMKTASFGTVWADPAKADISAMDRHMARNFLPEIENDPKLGPAFKKGAVELFNQQKVGKNAVKGADLKMERTHKQNVKAYNELKKADPNWVDDYVINRSTAHGSTKFRDTKGNIRDTVPKHLRDLPIDPPGGTVPIISPIYSKMLEVNTQSARDLGLSVFGEQWRLWDRIRRGIEPHEAVHRDAQKLPPMTGPEMLGALRTQKEAGYSTPQMDPTKPKRQQPYDTQKGMAWLTGGNEVPQVGLAKGGDLAGRQAQSALRDVTEDEDQRGILELLQALRQQ